MLGSPIVESLSGTILAVSVGAVSELVTTRRQIESAFVKTPTEGRVWLGAASVSNCPMRPP